MLPFLTRRVVLSACRPTATYARLLLQSSSAFSSRGVLDSGLRASATRSLANAQRNASTRASVAADKTKSVARGGKKPVKKLTPEEKAARKESLRVKNQLEKEKKAAALKAQRERLKAKQEEAKAKVKAKAEKEKAKKVKLIKPPPRRLNAYALFIKDLKKPLAECATEWHNLPEEKKQEYAVLAKTMTEKLKEDFNAFVKTITPLDVLRYNRHQRTKGGYRLHVKFSNNKRPAGPFMKYLREFRTRPENAGKPLMEVTKAAGVAWRSLTEGEKNEYRAAHDEATTA